MKILVSGSSGLIGSATVEALRAAGHTVCRLVRPQSAQRKRKAGLAAPPATDVHWNPVSGEMDLPGAAGADAVVHLGGASIGEGRWNEARKQLLRTSRVDATRNLVSALGKLDRPPQVLISASAMGFYGDRGEEKLIEQSGPGRDFLALLARDWEAEAARAAAIGARVVMLRFGLVLAARGGALRRMLLPFRLGLGGRLGSGKQWMSWLTVQEVVGIVRYALENPQVRGPINAVTPNPVRNSEFTKILGRVLHRPTLFPAPAAMLRLVLGEMAGALLLSSQRVLPGKLQGLRYHFVHPELEPALRVVLGRTA